MVEPHNLKIFGRLFWSIVFAFMAYDNLVITGRMKVCDAFQCALILAWPRHGWFCLPLPFLGKARRKPQPARAIPGRDQ
jgi:hypothetical protein